MLPFLQNHPLPISLLTLLALFGVGLFLPSILLPLGIALILLVFAFSFAVMKEKYQTQYQRGEITQSEMRGKTRKGFALLAAALLLTILLGVWVGGWAAGLAGSAVEIRWSGWGSAAALASAILASFAVGYAVSRGVGKLSRK